MDGGAHEKFESLKFKRAQAPELESYRETIGGAIITARPDRAFRAKYSEYEVAEAAWKDARELRELKYAMDGVSFDGYCCDLWRSDFNQDWPSIWNERGVATESAVETLGRHDSGYSSSST